MSAIQTQTVSIASITVDAARDIVRRHQGDWASLRDAVVLIPDSHAASDVAHALREAAGLSVLLLPRITTLRLWAATADPGKAIQARAVREAVLYGALAGHTSLGEDRKSTRLNSSH